jgi:hypothetical protein
MRVCHVRLSARREAASLQRIWHRGHFREPNYWMSRAARSGKARARAAIRGGKALALGTTSGQALKAPNWLQRIAKHIYEILMPRLFLLDVRAIG